MKLLIACILSVVLFGCYSRPTNHLSGYETLVIQESGTKYLIVREFGGGVAVINLTKDSLEVDQLLRNSSQVFIGIGSQGTSTPHFSKQDK